MLDLVANGLGNMEAAFQFARDNDISLSDIPIVGTVYVVGDVAMAKAGTQGAAVIGYLRKNKIVVGTLANAGALLNDDGVTPLLNDDGRTLEAD